MVGVTGPGGADLCGAAGDGSRIGQTHGRAIHPFDLLVVMLLSEVVSNALGGADDSITAGLLGAATLIGLNVTVAYITSSSRRAQTLIEGRPVLIGRDGEIFGDVLKKQHVPMPDVQQALREADCDQAEMKFAFLEADGCISILQNSSQPDFAD